MNGADMDERLLQAAMNKGKPLSELETIELQVTMDELSIIIEGLYWEGNTVGPDSKDSRKLYRKLYDIRKRMTKQKKAKVV